MGPVSHSLLHQHCHWRLEIFFPDYSEERIGLMQNLATTKDEKEMEIFESSRIRIYLLTFDNHKAIISVNSAAVEAGIAKWQAETCITFIRQSFRQSWGNGLEFILGNGWVSNCCELLRVYKMKFYRCGTHYSFLYHAHMNVLWNIVNVSSKFIQENITKHLNKILKVSSSSFSSFASSIPFFPYYFRTRWRVFFRCYSYIGRVGNSPQQVSIGYGCTSLGTVTHEIGHLQKLSLTDNFILAISGHALGLYHEQARYDRDDYVRILTQNIQSTYLSQFSKQSR